MSGAGLPEGVSELVMPDELVTGEAVVLDLRPASFASRALATALDIMVVFIVMFSVFWLLGALNLDVAADDAVGLVVLVSVLVLMPAGWEALSRGRSPGKAAAGLRVVRDDGGPIRWRQALVRSLLAILELYMLGGSAALISSLASPRGKRIGDLLAGTFVVRERTASAPAPPPPMPPELAAWAMTADIGRVPDSLAVACRQLLARASRLHPGSRARLGTELAGQLATLVAPPPPGVVSPERFMAAVLAERHRRALIRMSVLEQRRVERALRRGAAPVLSPSSTTLIGSPTGEGRPE